MHLADLVSRLLVDDAGSRLDAAQALAHPFFAAETPLHWMLHSASARHSLTDISVGRAQTLHTVMDEMKLHAALPHLCFSNSARLQSHWRCSE